MNPPHPCPSRSDLERLLLGRMHDAEAAALEGHVEQCERCLEAVRTLRVDDPLLEAVRVGVRQEALVGESIDDGLLTLLCGLAATSPPYASDSQPAEKTEEVTAFLAPPQEPDELGRFGPYGVLRVLGSGGMGLVFAARQRLPRRVVALKMILTGPAARRDHQVRFRAEAEAVARLQHPNIVAVYEAGEHEGRPYFTMEYVAGGSLAQKLAVAPLAHGAAAQFVETLARAVQFAHDRRVLHRDLKPANVLLTEDGTPKLTDFGLAKELSSDPDTDGPARTESGAILGTPNYMAPEQALGSAAGTIGPPADVYALGAILYEALTGRPPFKAATVLETLEQVRTQEPVPPRSLQPGTPRDLQTICLKCLEKEPVRRYSTAAALADDLGRFRRGESILARPTPMFLRAARWARRSPTLAALIGVSGLFFATVVVGGAVYQMQLRSALQQAEDNAVEMRHQRERADLGYRTARDTLNRMNGKVQARGLGEIPQLKELQRELLEEALGFYRSSIGGAEDPDPGVRLDTAVACQQAGAIQQALGRNPAAVEHYRQATDLLAGLPSELRDSAEALMARVRCSNALAILARVEGRHTESEGHHRDALEASTRWAELKPDDLRAHSFIAVTEHGLGDLYWSTGKLDRAETSYKRAVAIRTQILRDRPDDEGWRVALAEDHISLALVYQNCQRLDEARAASQKADAMLRPLVERPARQGEHALSLAGLNVNWSFLLRADGQIEEAMKRLDEAVQLTESVLAQEPRHTGARYYAYNSHGARAQLHEAMKRYADAARDWDRVVDLDTGSKPWLNRVLRAIILARAGEHARAAAEVKVLASDPAVIPEGRHDLACASALAAGAAKADKRLPLDESKRLAESHAGAAVAILAKLLEEGYFKDAKHARALQEDPDLDSLRQREDFTRLLSGLGGP